MKHTPGPWVVVSHSLTDGSLGIGPKDAQYLVASAHNAPSVGDVIFGRTPKEQHANAKLIAAAPDLLEALQRIANHERRGPVAAAQLVAEAKAAIAKATS